MQDQTVSQGRNERLLRKTADDLRTWVVACPVAYTVLSRMTGVSRVTIYRCNDYTREWNPSLLTLTALARARDTLEAEIRNPTQRKDPK